MKGWLQLLLHVDKTVLSSLSMSMVSASRHLEISMHSVDFVSDESAGSKVTDEAWSSEEVCFST